MSERIREPDEPLEGEPDRRSGLVRRILSSRPSPEERLEQLIARRRRELEEEAAQFDAKIADLERREELLRDSRASVERMLRLGTNDLEAKEVDLAQLVDELAERETRMAAKEADLDRRRAELGAVELKRAAVEQRERSVASREERAAQLEAQLAEREASLRKSEPEVVRPVQLAFVPGPPEYRLVAIEPVEARAGAILALDEREYTVLRVGRSPYPGDERVCAYLVQGSRGGSSSDGSS